jgi:type IV secretory pathway VirB10-like protein
MSFLNFFTGDKKNGSGEPSGTPTGLAMGESRKLIAARATYINNRPIILGGAVMILLVMGSALAISLSESAPHAAPVKIAPSNGALTKNTQLGLEQSAAEVKKTQEAAVKPEAATASAASTGRPPADDGMPPQAQSGVAMQTVAPPPAPTQPSPQEVATETALNGPLSSGGNGASLSAVEGTQNGNGSSDVQSLLAALKASGVSLPAGGGVVTPPDTANFNAHLLRKAVSPYQMDPGTVIPAVLVTGIDSDLPGKVTALVSQNVYSSQSGAYLLIPAGSKLIGTYASQVKIGQNRLFVAWTQIILPNGSSMNLSGFPGTSPKGYSGFEDEVDDHTWSIFKSALLISLVQTGISLSQPGYGSSGASMTQAISPSQVAEQNLANTFGQAEAQMLQQSLNVSPTLKIRPGYTFGVLVPKALVFPGPYRHSVVPGSTTVLPVGNAAVVNPYQTGGFVKETSASPIGTSSAAGAGQGTPATMAQELSALMPASSGGNPAPAVQGFVPAPTVNDSQPIPVGVGGQP